MFERRVSGLFYIFTEKHEKRQRTLILSEHDASFLKPVCNIQEFAPGC